jgi:hypothetical protein
MPIIIIGVFVPPKLKEDVVKEIPQSTFNTEDIKQQSLFDF